MEVIKKQDAWLSEDGRQFKAARPNFYDLQRLHQEFIDCIEETLKPCGLVVSVSGMPEVKWDGKAEVFDLTKLDKVTFNLTLVKYK